jgi:hypothetical protein
MFDLEANKSIALRLVEVFNGRRLDLLRLPFDDLARPGHRIRGDREEGHGGAGDVPGLLAQP